MKLGVEIQLFLVDAVVNYYYCMAYTDLAEDCKDKLSPQKMLVKQFMSKIKPEKMCEMVQLCESKDLSRCVADTLDWMKRRNYKV